MTAQLLFTSCNSLNEAVLKPGWTGRKAAGWRNAEIEHNTPRCVELGGGARARKFYLAVKNEFLDSTKRLCLFLYYLKIIY